MEALEPDAILISETDRHTFTLWYLRYARRRRTDIAVLDADLLHFPWYRTNARHVHPDVFLVDATVPEIESQCESCSPLIALIEGNRDARPIYLTDLNPRLEDRYRLSPQGPLYRLLGPREG